MMLFGHFHAVISPLKQTILKLRNKVAIFAVKLGNCLNFDPEKGTEFITNLPAVHILICTTVKKLNLLQHNFF